MPNHSLFSRKKLKSNGKILIIHNVLWSHYKAVVFTELNRLLLEEGFTPSFVHIALSERQRTNLGEIDKSLHKYPYKVLFETNFENTRSMERMKAVIKEILDFKPDLVVLPGYSDISVWAGLIVAKLKGTKVLVCIDSTEMDKKRIWWKEFVKSVFARSCAAAFCYGLASALYAQKLGCKNVVLRYQATPNQEIERIYDEVYIKRDEIKRKYGLKTKNFIYVGRLSEEKNVETLIRAFHEISKEADDWGLIIVGNGPERERLETMVGCLGLSDYVFFTGGVSWREVPIFYALADVFVLPSASEPWGLVVNEAMVCGLPVIVSNRAGASFDLVINGKNGFTFNPHNWKALAELMGRFTKGEVNLKEMGHNSREIIQKYTPENAARQMLIGIKQVLGVA